MRQIFPPYPEPTPRSVAGVLSLLPREIQAQITERQQNNILRRLIAGDAPSDIAASYQEDPTH